MDYPVDPLLVVITAVDCLSHVNNFYTPTILNVHVIIAHTMLKQQAVDFG